MPADDFAKTLTVLMALIAQANRVAPDLVHDLHFHFRELLDAQTTEARRALNNPYRGQA